MFNANYYIFLSNCHLVELRCEVVNPVSNYSFPYKLALALSPIRAFIIQSDQVMVEIV